jgi:two-component system catabolic regulation response regulator CreB
MPTPHVLLIQDDPVAASVVRVIVRHEGASVTLLGSGRDAIAYMTGRPPWHLNPFPTLVLLDLDLPGADGLQALRWMSDGRLLRVAPVIVFSASRDPGDEAHALALGARRYLRKPVDPQALRGEITAVLRPPSAAHRSVAEG